MHIETETRWILLGTDGRHVSLGCTGPSEGEVLTTSNAHSVQWPSGWVAGLDGDR